METMTTPTTLQMKRLSFAEYGRAERCTTLVMGLKCIEMRGHGTIFLSFNDERSRTMLIIHFSMPASPAKEATMALIVLQVLSSLLRPVC